MGSGSGALSESRCSPTFRKGPDPLIFADDLTSVANPSNCFSEDATHYCSLFYSTTRQAAANLDHDHIVLGESLNSDLGRTFYWDCFNTPKTYVVCLNQTFSDFYLTEFRFDFSSTYRTTLHKAE